MAQAPAYNRTKNFNENSSERTDHGALNAELDRAAQSINALRSNLATLQNDDGTVRSAVVTLASLTDEAVAALSVPGPRGERGLEGDRGLQGIQGLKGDRGASFTADVRDLMANRTLYDLQGKGFSFLSLDTGRLYFKLSSEPEDWSAGYEYGRGDTGLQGVQGIQGLQGIPGLQGIQGIQGLAGLAGEDGEDGIVTAVDLSTKTASLIGRASVSARLVLEEGELRIVLQTQ